MIVRTWIAAALFVAFSPSASAQDCASYPLFKQGAAFTQTSYDAGGKNTGSTRTSVKSAAQAGSTWTAELHSDSANAQGKSTSSVDYTASCEPGKVSMDMKAWMPSEKNQEMRDFTLTFDGKPAEYPSVFTPGMALPDGVMKVTFAMASPPPNMPPGVGSMVMNVVLKNRKVEAAEKVTTSAGTFETWKITYDLETSMTGMMGGGPATVRQVTEWFTAGVGPVKTETRMKSKLEGSTQLTALEQP